MYITGCAGGRETQRTVPVSQRTEKTTGKGKQQAPSVVMELSKEGVALSAKEEMAYRVSLWQKMLEQRKQQQLRFSQMRCKMKSAQKKKKRPSGNLVAKALAIARRIMRGDKVPPKDESFLFRYNSDLYLKAKTMAMQNQKPKKHKSLMDEKEEKGTVCISMCSDSIESGGESVSPEESEDSEE